MLFITDLDIEPIKVSGKLLNYDDSEENNIK